MIDYGLRRIAGTVTMYIYNLPYSKRRELQRILDVGGHWKDLAARLNWSVEKVFYLEMAYRQPGGSPTESLLMEWGHSNATVEMLVFHLLQMNLNRAAELFRGLVPDAMFISAEDNSFVAGNVSTPASDGTDALLNPLVWPVPANNHGNNHGIVATDRCMNSLSSLDGIFVQQNTHAGGRVNDGFSLPVSDFTKSDNASDELHELHASWKTLNIGLPASSGRLQPVESIDIGTTTTHNESSWRLPETSSSPVSSASAEGIPSNVFLYKFSTIADATKNFSPEHLIGSGSFGVVYRGRIANTEYAIKKMFKARDGRSDYRAEITILHTYRHTNISMLCGCSIDGPDVCLVFEYMTNGSLHDRLMRKNGTPVLSWQHRHSILTDAAAGLQYLHTVEPKPVIHGDIKSSNIVLGPHFEAKIADFGCAREATSGTTPGVYTHATIQQQAHLCETYAYLPSEFLTSDHRFGLATDIYSFGVVIYETCTGLKVYDASRSDSELLADYVSELRLDSNRLLEVKDSRTSNWPDTVWLTTMSIGDKCTNARRKYRPPMTSVYRELDVILAELRSKRDAPDVESSKDVCLPSAKRLPIGDYPKPDQRCDAVLTNQDEYSDYRRPVNLQTKQNIVDPDKFRGMEACETAQKIAQCQRDSCLDSEIDRCSPKFSPEDRGRVARMEALKASLMDDVKQNGNIASFRHAAENESVSPLELLSQPSFESGNLSDFDAITRKKANFVAGDLSLLFDDDDNFLCAKQSILTDTPQTVPGHQMMMSGRVVENGNPVGDKIKSTGPSLTFSPEDHDRVARMEILKASLGGGNQR